MMGWLFRMMRNCTAERFALNKGRMLRLAYYIREQLGRPRDETGDCFKFAGALARKAKEINVNFRFSTTMPATMYQAEPQGRLQYGRSQCAGD